VSARRLGTLVLALAVLLGAGWASAQWGRRRRGAAAEPPVADGLTWELSKDQPEDVFTFARLRYGSWRHSWDIDWPDADLNLSFRLQQLTSLKVLPAGKIIDITDEQLRDYPFVYMVEPGGLELSEGEVTALRRYLLGGGFMMADDFWGEDEWNVFARQMKRVFADRDFQELELNHPIFHAVFDLPAKPQMPSINVWRSRGVTYEREDAHDPQYRALFDDKGRMMVIACHNTDLGDGWEREGEDPTYFRKFSEKQAYPMAINVIFYAMTH
jgi:hypothetical protein